MALILALLLTLTVASPTLAQTVDIRERGRKVGEVRWSPDGSRAVEYRAGRRVGETRFSDDRAVRYEGGRKVREYRAR